MNSYTINTSQTRQAIGMQLNLDRARLFARVLNRPTFTALARGQKPQHVFKFLRDAGVIAGHSTVGKLFEDAFNTLRTSYRNEYVYKTAIANRIVFGRHSPHTSSLSVELPVGRSIVDVAVFNGTSTAYEVKTEFDTPRRLVSQTPDYLRAFDRVYIVTHPDWAEHYADVCDPHVGVLALNSRGSLQSVRPATSNAANVDSRAQFRMLRRNEYVPALEKLYDCKIELPNGLIAGHCEKLFSGLARETAHAIFLNAMRARKTNEETANFVSSLPNHLRILGYAAPLSKPQRARILEILDSDLP